MKTLLSGALICCTALLCLATPAQAQLEEWEVVVNEQLEAAHEALTADGFSLIRDHQKGYLANESRERISFTLRAGVAYRIVGFCDNDCDDLDLTLYDPKGKKVTEDVAVDDYPLLSVTPDETGTYQVEVYMVSCSISPCYYGIGIWGQGDEVGGASNKQGDSYSGRLESGDRTLTSGEYVDYYTFEARAGQRIIAELRSTSFDTWLIVKSPSGEQAYNDDFEGDVNLSRVELDAAESGTWNVLATSYEKGETGPYEVVINVSDGSGGSSSSGPRIESGELGRGDETIDTGEFIDLYTFEGTAGEQVVFDLRSVNFDTYLIVLTPGQERHQNDDFEGDMDRSLINLELTESGTYTVGVTSYEAGETGAYDLHIQRGSPASASSGPRVERGALSSGDQTLGTGEYLDVFTFEGTPGQHARIDVASSVFDTYLIVTGPGEFKEDNDDVENAPGHSIVEFDLTNSGTYTAIVTSYSAGETGDYELSIELDSAAQGSTDSDNPGQQDIRRLTPGQSLSGRLEPGDSTLEADQYTDIFTFDGQAGQTISVDLTSSDFDTYIGLVFPSEEFLENDDHEGSTSRSHIELTLQESGRYSVVATSYASGETGSYQVTLTAGSAGPASASGPSGAGGNVYGLFVGISDYPGEGSDLSFCAEDATTFYAAMQRGAGMPAGNGTVYTDSQATTTNIRNALREFGSRVGPDDVFVFFYSGHGSRVDRPDGFERADPDGIDESIFLYDDQILDNEMAEIFDDINARIAILVLDSCFSGGFAKDVISVPGRMGFFSSEEDVTSMVAAKFMAGGYLAKFIADAVGDRLGDLDRDGEINALELSQYLFEQYRAEVKSGVKSDYVSLNSRELGYQHLIVDRGSIGAYDVVFR